MTEATPSSELRHLGFVARGASATCSAVADSKTYATATRVYATLKEKNGTVKAGAATMEKLCCNVVGYVVDKAPGLLHGADAKVSSTLAYASHVYDTQVLQSATVGTALALKARLQSSRATSWEPAYVTARDRYFALIEAHISSLKEQGVALPALAAERVAAAVAAGRAKASADAAAVLESVHNAWLHALAHPQVAAALHKAHPAVAAAKASAWGAAQQAVAAAGLAKLYVTRLAATSPAYQAHVAPRVSALAEQPRVKACVAVVSETLSPLVASF